jgi:hypothetical protein
MSLRFSAVNLPARAPPPALAAQPAHLDGRRIPIVWIAIVGLTCSDVAKSLRSAIGSRALLATFSRDPLSYTRIRDARQIQGHHFKLTHYPSDGRMTALGSGSFLQIPRRLVKFCT